MKCGDNTPKLLGRYTLNPLKHFDIIGLLCMIVVHFGWARPVPIDPNNFRRRTLGCLLVAISGILANLITALLIYPILILSLRMPNIGLFDDLIIKIFFYIFNLSLTFAAFNLLPLMPLDGFRIIQSFTKPYNRFRIFMERYSAYILLGLVGLNFLGDLIYQVAPNMFIRMPALKYLQILNITIGWLGNIFGKPIILLWGLIF